MSWYLTGFTVLTAGKKGKAKKEKHGDLRMVILWRQQFSSSELNVEDVSSTHSNWVEPRISSFWDECFNS